MFHERCMSASWMRLSKQALAVCMVMKHSQKVLKIVSRTNEISAQLKSVCQTHFTGCSWCLLSGGEVMFHFNYTHPMIGERCSCFSLAFAGWVRGAGQGFNPKQKSGASNCPRGTGRESLAQMLEKERGQLCVRRKFLHGLLFPTPLCDVMGHYMVITQRATT